MNLMINNHRILSVVLISFIISAIMVPIVRKLSFHSGAVDEPNDRRINKVAMPNLGGLAIFLSFLFGYMFFADKSNQMLSILIGSFLIILIGMFDSIKPIKARYKLVVQIISALIVVLYGGIELTKVDFFGIYISFGIFSEVITILFIVGITNAINLIDGMDGLAAGVSSIYFLTISIIAIILNRLGGLDVILSLIMLGATLGFLLYNFPPAMLFMGDAGSYFLGYVISIIALLGFKNVTLTSLVIPIVILAIPIFDTFFAIIRRILKGKNPLTNPDKEHLHHQLLKMKFSQRKTILIIYFINIVFSSVSIFYILGNRYTAMCIYTVLMLLLLIVVLKTNILFEHKKKEKKLKKKLTK